MDRRILQRRGEDEKDLQLRGAYSRPARHAKKRAAPGAVRGPPVRRVRPPPGAGAAGQLAVAGRPRGHRVVLRGLHDLHFPAWPRVRNRSITSNKLNKHIYLVDAPLSVLVVVVARMHAFCVLPQVAGQEFCKQRVCLAVQRAPRRQQSLPPRTPGQGMHASSQFSVSCLLLSFLSIKHMFFH